MFLQRKMLTLRHVTLRYAKVENTHYAEQSSSP